MAPPPGPLLSLCLLVCSAPLASASSPEKDALLAFKGSEPKNDRNADLRTWREEAAEPCAEGHSSYSTGWTGLMCSREGGTVTIIDLQFGGVGGDVRFFAQLEELRALNLSENPSVRGDVGALGGLVHLNFLGLYGTSVHGEPGSLRALTRLGEDWMAPEGTSTCVPTGPGFKECQQDAVRGVLFLAGSYVSGSVKDLREIEGLGSEWGPAAEADSFTPCTSYAASCQASGLSLVPGAKDLAGRDECGCCVGSTMVRDERTGMCDRAKFTVTITSSSSAEPGKVGSYGAKDFEREAKLHEHP